MIPIKELKASYIKVLREAVPGMRIYSNEVEEGYETPSLFVQMIPLIFKQRETASITRSSYMFETTFLQYKKNDAEQLEIIEKIRDKLGDHLEVEDRKIFVEEPEVQYTGQTHNIIQLESINRNLVDEAKEQFKDGSMPVSVANEMAGLPEEIQRDLSKKEDIKLSQVKEIKEDSKENAKIMCKYDNSKNCRYRCENTPLGWKPTQQHCEYVCENVLENKKISEKDLESVTFTFQDVKTTLRYINQQISKTKMNDKETIVRLKVISESLKKYLKEMKVVTDYGR